VRVAIFADTHDVLDARIAEVARTCDLAVHAGDVASDLVMDVSPTS